MATETKPWTLQELDRLPDDGNRYEVVWGELYVTPAPSNTHEMVAAELSRVLGPYVQANGLGIVLHPRAVIQRQKSQLEPDLMVRARWRSNNERWVDAPLPILVVEVLSATTHWRDVGRKREFYMAVGVPEYWMVDPRSRSVTVVRQGREDEVMRERLSWQPAGAAEALEIELAEVFG